MWVLIVGGFCWKKVRRGEVSHPGFTRECWGEGDGVQWNGVCFIIKSGMGLGFVLFLDWVIGFGIKKNTKGPYGLFGFNHKDHFVFYGI